MAKPTKESRLRDIEKELLDLQLGPWKTKYRSLELQLARVNALREEETKARLNLEQKVNKMEDKIYLLERKENSMDYEIMARDFEIEELKEKVRALGGDL